MGARIGDRLDDARALYGLEMLDLGLERSIALRGHGHFIHRQFSSFGPPDTVQELPSLSQDSGEMPTKRALAPVSGPHSFAGAPL
jgi:hypothetical protein